MNIKRWSAVSVIALVATAAACGSSSKPTTTATTAAPATTKAATSGTTAASTAGSTAGTTAGSTAGTTAGTTATTTAGTTATTAAKVNFDTTATLTVGQVARPPAINPHKGTSPTIDFSYMSPMYDRLVELQADGTLKPMLATSWTASADGLTTDFKLRTDVKFHDGTPFNADAAVANLEYVFKTDGTLAQSYIKQVFYVSTTKIDDSTIRITTSQKAQLLPYYLATFIEVGAMVAPAMLNSADLATTEAGTGPFKLGAIAQDRITYNKVDNYWDTEIVASAPKTLINVGITDDTARLNALLSGQIDATSLLSPIANLDATVKSGNLKSFVVTKTNRTLGFYTNLKAQGMDNAKVRQALSLAVDRKALSQVVGTSSCLPSIQPFGPGTVGYDPSISVDAAYNPTKAKQLLADAGVTNLSLDAVTTESALFSTVGTVIIDNFKAIGVTLKITAVPTQEISATFASGKYALNNTSATGEPDPMMLLNDIYLGPRGAPGGSDPALPALAAKANEAALGTPERNTAFQSVSRYLADNPQYLVWCVWPNTLLERSNISGVDRNGIVGLTAPIDTRHIGVIKA